MIGNIVGEPTERYVNEEIVLRQAAHGSGGNVNVSRNPSVLNYLNNRQAWIKLASGISLDNISRLKDITKGEIGTSITDTVARNYAGPLLAKNFILFNTISSLGKNYTFRSGVKNTQDLLDIFAQYGGIGGSNQGLQPIPGIVSATVKARNRGSIREATVQLKAYNKLQFSIIELLYLRLGCSMMLEWGWDKELVVEQQSPLKLGTRDVGSTIIEQQWFKSSGTSQLQMLNSIETYRKTYSGNYDGFFGKVSNFNWTYNPDGSYNIDLKLITVGDVIESLVANVGFKGLNGSSLVNLKNQYQKFTESYNYGIGQSSYNPDPENELSPNTEEDTALMIDVASTDAITNYLFVNSIALKSDSFRGDFYNIRSAAYKQYGEDIVKQVPEFKNFYVRLGTFLEFLEDTILTKTKGTGNFETILNIDTDTDTNLVSAYLDQISFDPRVCLIHPKFSKKVSDSLPKLEGKPEPLFFLEQKLPEYTYVTKGVVYAKLMNLYLNTDFLINLIKNKKTDKNEVKLFPFLNDICKEINKSLGGVNNIEPIIKDDKTITFIDQNPISGFGKIASDLGIEFNKSITPLNVYGYGKDNSNFVKNISFNTKIGPNLSTMITVGATAAGKNNTKNYEATAFEKWNDGLSDRFNQEMVDPEYDPNIEAAPVDNTQIANKAIAYINSQSSQYGASYARFNKNGEVGELAEENALAINSVAFNASNRYKNYKNKREKRKNLLGQEYEASVGKIFLGYSDQFGNVYPASQYPDNEIGFRKFAIAAYKVFNQKELEKAADEQAKKNAAEEIKSSFEGWIVQAFGGETSKANNLGTNIAVNQTTSKETKTTNTEVTAKAQPKTSYNVSKLYSKYFNFAESNDFYSRGKKAFKEYINKEANNKFVKDSTPSNTIGFIPVEFNLDLDGISGFKLYNSIKINQQFLPPQYPVALRFLIQNLDHKIDGNGWITSLKTLSVPVTEADTGLALADELSLEDLQALEASLPEPPLPTTTPGYSPSGATFDITNPGSIDVTSPSGFPVLTKNKNTGQNQIVNGNGGKYARFVGDIDKTPGLKRIFFDEITMKTSVIIHHTAGWSYGQPNAAASSIEGWTERAIEENYPVATQYVITQDGHIELVFNEAFWSYHGSIGTQDKYTIGIELQALGYMKGRRQTSNGSVSYTRGDLTVDQNRARKYIKSSITSQDVIDVDALFSKPVDENGNEITFRGYNYFQKYSPEQLQALEQVLRGIKSRHPQIDFTYDYNRMFPRSPLYDSSTANLKNRSGIYTHNTFRKKTDVFPQLELLQLLKRLGTELGGSQPLPNGQFYGQNGNFTAGTTNTSFAGAVSEPTPSNAWDYKTLMFDVVDTVFQEMRALSSEFGGTFVPKEGGDKDNPNSEVGRLFDAAERLKQAIKTDSDSRILERFNNTDGWFKTNEGKKKWAISQLADNRTYRKDSYDGYDSPNTLDSDLENGWEALGGVFNGEQVDF
jgi:hypothetical protein